MHWDLSKPTVVWRIKHRFRKLVVMEQKNKLPVDSCHTCVWIESLWIYYAAKAKIESISRCCLWLWHELLPKTITICLSCFHFLTSTVATNLFSIWCFRSSITHHFQVVLWFGKGTWYYHHQQSDMHWIHAIVVLFIIIIASGTCTGSWPTTTNHY